jgi:uncharacterized repeat protein (TIGR02543 family)
MTGCSTIFSLIPKKEHTIYFDSNGGTSVVSITQMADSVIKEPDIPVRDGYFFCGWFLDNFRYHFETMPDMDITLRAEWKEEASLFEFGLHDDQSTLSITGYNGVYQTDIIIPDVFDSLPVTEIGSHAFQDLGLNSIVIGEGITDIGKGAFEGCFNIKEIVIPSSVEHIGNQAFMGCNSLEKVTFENNSKLQEICECAFYQCPNLSEISLPDSVRIIGNFAFMGCQVNVVSLPESLETLGCQAIEADVSLSSITLPDSLKNLEVGVFLGFEGLSTINVSPLNPYFESANGVLFSEDLSELVAFPKRKPGASYDIPATVTKIRDFAFEGCPTLTAITIPQDVTIIGTGAFKNCTNIREIILPGNITVIGNGTFLGCNSLQKINIPASVASIGYHNFQDCPNLTVYCETDQAPRGWADGWSDAAAVLWNQFSE